MFKNSTFIFVACLGFGASMSGCGMYTKEDTRSGAMKRSMTNDTYTTISEAFSTHDINADGYIDQIEFTNLQLDTAIVNVSKIIPEIKNNPLLFNEVDQSGDEHITLEELTDTIMPLLPKGL